MKKFLLSIAGLGAVFAALVFWYSVGSVGTPEEVVACDAVLEQHSHKHFSAGLDGDGGGLEDSVVPAAELPPITFAEIKSGPFREQLEKLPEEFRAKALAQITEDPALLQDIDSLRVSPSGRLIYVCPLRVPEESALFTETGAAEVAAAEASGISVPINSPPLLHSRPGATKVLFLDFNGHVISGTDWEENGVTSWDCWPYSTDSDQTTFSSLEQSRIVEIWERVSEDYAPFDIDVTTEQPASWNRYTGHVLITPTTDKNGARCPHYGWGGIAFVNVFDSYDYSYNATRAASPAWVTEVGTASIVAEAASHEFGHNLSLHHDGSSSETYYGGHAGVVVPGWGAIMGTGYRRNISQWSKGEYFDSNQDEDDLAEIAERLSYRADDVGDSHSSSAWLGTTPLGEIEQAGVIETTDDPDVFRFSTGSGEVSISATPYRAATGYWGGNLDILLQLYDDDGDLVAENNPSHLASASISTTVSSGTYFLHVKPVGAGTPMSSPASGYTSYGSLGQYFISGYLSADIDSDDLPNQWEMDHFGSITGAMAQADADGDGANNLTEYVAGTDPKNATSVFEVTQFSAPEPGGTGFVVSWNPMAGRVYNVSWTYGISVIPFTDISGDLPHTINSFTDTEERPNAQNFYRVDVRMED